MSVHRISAHLVDVVVWAIAQREPITKHKIIARWGVHKSTAWRWVPTLEEARQRVQMLGIPPAPQYGRTRVPTASPEARA